MWVRQHYIIIYTVALAAETEAAGPCEACSGYRRAVNRACQLSGVSWLHSVRNKETHDPQTWFSGVINKSWQSSPSSKHLTGEHIAAQCFAWWFDGSNAEHRFNCGMDTHSDEKRLGIRKGKKGNVMGWSEIFKICWAAGISQQSIKMLPCDWLISYLC